MITQRKSSASKQRRARVKRVYDERVRGDGVRILVDRLWPRGVRKEEAAFDDWRKDLAPSTELRKFYGHQPQRFAEFAMRYRAELRRGRAKAAVEQVLDELRRRPVTLLTATHDVEHSGAAVLARHVDELTRRRSREQTRGGTRR